MAGTHPENALIYANVDLYQLDLFNPSFWGYFYIDSVNLCPDITKNQSC